MIFWRKERPVVTMVKRWASGLLCLFSAGAEKEACGQCDHSAPKTLLLKLKQEVLGPSGYGATASANGPMDH